MSQVSPSRPIRYQQQVTLTAPTKDLATKTIKGPDGTIRVSQKKDEVVYCKVGRWVCKKIDSTTLKVFDPSAKPKTKPVASARINTTDATIKLAGAHGQEIAIRNVTHVGRFSNTKDPNYIPPAGQMIPRNGTKQFRLGHHIVATVRSIGGLIAQLSLRQGHDRSVVCNLRFRLGKPISPKNWQSIRKNLFPPEPAQKPISIP